MQAIRIPAARHHPAGELINDDDFAVLDDVVLVSREQLVRPKRLVRVVHKADIARIIERGLFREQAHFLEIHLDGFDTLLRQGDRALFLVDLEMVLGEQRNEFVDRDIHVRLIFGRA